MIKRANNILRLVIPLLLVLCTQPTVHDCGLRNVQSLQESAGMVHFTSAFMEPSIGAVDLAQKDNYKSSDRNFHDDLIFDHISIISKSAFVFTFSAFIDRFATKTGFKAISSRAPPRFIF